MGQWFLTKLRNWFILIIGLIVIVGGLSAASFIQSQPTPMNTTANGTVDQPRSTSEQPSTLQIPRQSPAEVIAGGHENSDKLAYGSASTKGNPTTSASPAPRVQEHAAGREHDHAPAQTSLTVVQKAASAAAAPTGEPALTSDAAAGRQVFRKCQACHSLQPTKNGVGPSLAGIVGKKAATEAGYDYSSAMKASNLTWSVATLDAYLADPQKVVPQNKMPFPGLKTENERNSLISYLVASASPAQPLQAPAAPPQATSPPQAAARPAPAPSDQAVTSYIPGIRYTLRSGIAEGRMVFIGIGGTIDGQVNPVLSAAEGQLVQVTLINGEGAEHDVVFTDQGPAGSSPHVFGKGASTNIAFVASKAGDYV